jgi:hypothetical protein
MLWAILIPVGAAVFLAAVIVGVGELYLAIHGTGAIIAAIALMCLITGGAAVLANRTSADTAHPTDGGQGHGHGH